MARDLSTTVEIYKLTDELRGNALKGLTRTELLHRANEISNPLIWMAGHLAVTRFRIGNVLGPEEKTPMEDLFGGPSSPEHANRYPEIEEIDQLHRTASERMFERMKSVTPELLAQKTPRADYSIRKALERGAYHEGLHMGQMFFLRKLLGHKPSDPIMD